MVVTIKEIKGEIVGFTVPPGTNCLMCRVPHKDQKGVCVVPLVGNIRAIDLSRLDHGEDISNCGVVTVARSSQQ